MSTDSPGVVSKRKLSQQNSLCEIATERLFSARTSILGMCHPRMMQRAPVDHGTPFVFFLFMFLLISTQHYTSRGGKLCDRYSPLLGRPRPLDASKYIYIYIYMILITVFGLKVCKCGLPGAISPRLHVPFI